MRRPEDLCTIDIHGIIEIRMYGALVCRYAYLRVLLCSNRGLHIRINLGTVQHEIYAVIVARDRYEVIAPFPSGVAVPSVL